MGIAYKTKEHRINLDARTTPTEGDCEQCSEPWCRFNVTPKATIDEYLAGNRKVIASITCDSYEVDPGCMK